MRSMRRRVREYDVARWAASFLDALGRGPGGHGGINLTEEPSNLGGEPEIS